MAFNNVRRILPQLSEEEAREALIHHVMSKRCYGRTAAENLSITEVKCSGVFVYELWTMTESRKTEWVTVPFKGCRFVGDNRNNLVPEIWEIDVRPPRAFKSGSKDVEVPHTAYVTICDKAGCKKGQVECGRCHGKKKVMCRWCGGLGRMGWAGRRSRKRMNPGGGEMTVSHSRLRRSLTACRVGQMCMKCRGLGRKNCNRCKGNGTVGCDNCNGKGQLKHYMKLTVTWKVHKSDWVDKHMDMPATNIKEAAGEYMWEETGPRVDPITFWIEDSVSVMSQELVQRHSALLEADPDERRIHLQKHSVRVVPVSEASCVWSDYKGSFYVYGLESRVFAPDYPQKHCMGICSIL